MQNAEQDTEQQIVLKRDQTYKEQIKRILQNKKYKDKAT